MAVLLRGKTAEGGLNVCAFIVKKPARRKKLPKTVLSGERVGREKPGEGPREESGLDNV